MSRTMRPVRAAFAAAAIVTSSCVLSFSTVPALAHTIVNPPPAELHHDRPLDPTDARDAADPEEPVADAEQPLATPPEPTRAAGQDPLPPRQKLRKHKENPHSEARARARDRTARELLWLVNSSRKHRGCSPLKTNTHLDRAAMKYAREMSRTRYFDHTARDGRTFDQRIWAAGYGGTHLGENIAFGYTSPASVHSAWMHSAGHRRNILDCRYRHIGIGYSGKDHFWVQNFGS